MAGREWAGRVWRIHLCDYRKRHITDDGVNLGTSVVKLTPGLQVVDWFTPSNVGCLSFLHQDSVLLAPRHVRVTKIRMGQK
jgi:hypothetical protein